MNDAPGVDRFETRRYLSPDLKRLPHREAPEALDQLGEGVGLEILHAQIAHSFDEPQVVDAAYVFVGDLLRETGLAPEARERLGVAQKALSNHLQSDGPAGLLVARLVDDAHPALPQTVDDDVARAEDLSRRVVEGLLQRSG